MTGTTCAAEHPATGTSCVQPAGPAHGDLHEDLDGRTWVDGELLVEALEDDVDEPVDVPVEVWLIRGALGIAGAAVVLLVLAFGLAVASVWTAADLSDRLEHTAILCVVGGVVAGIAGRAGIRSARGVDYDVRVELPGPAPVPPADGAR